MLDKFKRFPLLLFVIGLLAASAYFVFKPALEALPDKEAQVQVKSKVYKYGFDVDFFSFTEKTIKPNQFLSEILQEYKVPYSTIDKLARESKEIFDVRDLRVGKKYTILQSDTANAAEYFIYEPNAYRYIVFDLDPDPQVCVIEKEIEKRIESKSGVIESSLWNAMNGGGASVELIARMEDALAWSVDFYHIQKGDEFKLIYEQEYIENKKVGIGKLVGAYFKNAENTFYSIDYESEEYGGFYDEEGRPVKKAFLRSPVKYSRVSSGYNLNRRHPVLGYNRPHLGTDYAAPRGTPIMAVANGVVTKRSFTRGNGNYVKLKHKNGISTQYLHMSKFAKGVVPGTQVKQGQTIGYVGKTGLATGNHVCFRFWKNGKQVNHRKMNFPPAKPMAAAELPNYFKVRDKVKQQLDQIQIERKEVEPSEDEDESDTDATLSLK